MSRKPEEKTGQFSSEDYRAIVEDQTEFIVRWKPGGLRTFVNEPYCRYFNLKPEEALGTSFFSLIPEEGRKAVQEKIASLTPENPVAMDEHPVLRSDGQIGWQQWTDRAFFDSEGRMVEVLSVGRDITEHHQAEENLKRLSEVHQLALEAANMGIWDYDMVTDSYFGDERCHRIFGVPEVDSLSAEKVRKIIHPEDLGRVLKAVQDAQSPQSDGRYVAEYRICLPNGSNRCIRARGKVSFEGEGKSRRPVRFTGIVMDITRIKQEERAKRESERRLATLMANLPGMAYRCRNDENWTMEFVSEGCLTLTGYPPKDLIGNSKLAYEEIVHPKDREALRQGVQAALSERRPFRLEYRICSAGGEERWVWEQGTGVFGEENALVALEGFITDITDHKLAERALRESDRLKSQFVTTAAHEFRTPLTSIMGFAELLLSGEDISFAERNEFSKYIYRNAEDLSRIVGDLLDISRIEAGQEMVLSRSSTPVSEILNHLKSFLNLKPSEHEIEFDLKQKELFLDIDKFKVHQVLINLVDNAFKYSPKGSRIRILGEPGSKEYRVSIIDQGIGMTPEQVARIFDKFYRVDNSHTAREGVGLGMNIVRHIIEAHGGSILVKSEPGVGTEVSFTVPLERPSQPTA